MRIGALPSIKISDLERIDKLYKVNVYAGDNEEYFTFTTPECAREIDAYIEYSKKRDLLVKKYAGGICMTCDEFPTKQVIYQLEGIQLVEKYCDECFKKWDRLETKSKA